MAFGTFTESIFLTVDANFEFMESVAGTAIVLTLNPRETVSILFNVDAAGTADDLEIEILQGHRISTGNGLDGATGAADIELDTAADGFSTDDDMNGLYIIMTSGDESGEGRLIIDSVASDDGVVLSHDLSGTPSATETYDLYRFSPFRFTMDPQTTISSNAQNNDSITMNAVNGQFVAIVARADGATDAHRIQLSHQVDGVSV